MSAITIADLFL